VKRTSVLRDQDLDGLRLFGEDYPPAKRWLLYGGKKQLRLDGVECLPLDGGLVAMTKDL
jgi:hypothetical protein